MEIIDYIEQRNAAAAQDLNATIARSAENNRACRNCFGPAVRQARMSAWCIQTASWCIRWTTRSSIFCGYCIRANNIPELRSAAAALRA